MGNVGCLQSRAIRLELTRTHCQGRKLAEVSQQTHPFPYNWPPFCMSWRVLAMPLACVLTLVIFALHYIHMNHWNPWEHVPGLQWQGQSAIDSAQSDHEMVIQSIMNNKDILQCWLVVRTVDNSVKPCHNCRTDPINADIAHSRSTNISGTSYFDHLHIYLLCPICCDHGF